MLGIALPQRKCMEIIDVRRKALPSGSTCHSFQPMQGNAMKTKLITLCLFTSLACLSGAASAKGCLKGAAVGGVAGHVAGSHGVLGAAAGCAVGRHQANKKDAAQAQARTQAAPAPAPAK
jgi:hypothetical protein